MYGLNHNRNMPTPSWPQDNPNYIYTVPKKSLIYIFVNNNVLHIVDEEGFDSEVIKRAHELGKSYNLLDLSFHKFYHVLQIRQEGGQEILMLVGLRSKLTYDLQPLEILKKEAGLANLKTLEISIGC